MQKEQQDKGVLFYGYLDRMFIVHWEILLSTLPHSFFNVYHSEILIKHIYRNVIETYYVVRFINRYRKILSLSSGPLVVCYTI